MFIEEKNGIIRTSKGEFFKKEDISKIYFEEKDMKENRYILAEVEGIKDMKVYFSVDIYNSSHKLRMYNFYPENSDLYLTEKQSETLTNKLNTGEAKVVREYYKSMHYFFIGEGDYNLGEHVYTKTYEDKKYLLGQWAIDRINIEEFPFDMLASNTKDTKCTVK